MVFKKFCLKCEKSFQPLGKYQKLCDKCQLIKTDERNLKNRNKCGICKDACSGNLIIEYRKGKYIILCQRHFNKLEFIQDPKELRERIKYLKSYH